MRVLTAADRCDRCGAQAYVRVRQLIDEEAAGFDLLFCAHHTGEHAPALEGRFAITDDERDELDDIVRQPEPA